MITEESLHKAVEAMFHDEEGDPQLLTEVALFAHNAEFRVSPDNPEKMYMHEPSLIFGILLGIKATEES